MPTRPNPMEETPRKRSRTDNGVTGNLAAAGGDRLSALPDCLLHEIMSRMQARQLVQTCVLSTRWRHLWRSVPCIDADHDEFGAAAVAASYKDSEVCWEKFEDFMDILLLPGNVSIANLDKFRLHVTGFCTESARGYRWIRRGIKYDDGLAAQGPAGGIHRQGFSSTRSWRLRKLHLDNIWLDALFSEHVRSGCPNLEDLELNKCRCEFSAITSGSLKNLVMKQCRMIGCSEITSPTLKNLVIDGVESTQDCLLVITAPAAASVFLDVAARSFYGGLSVREMTPLAKVSVRSRSWKIVDHLKILGGVSDVMTNLELFQCEAMVPGELSATLPRFNNLRALELNGCDLSDGFRTLGIFLRNSTNLERLTLRLCKYSDDSKNKRRSSKSKNTEPTTPCPNLVDAWCKNLKLTKIIYRGEDIRQLIELLLCISENSPNNYIKLIKN